MNGLFAKIHVSDQAAVRLPAIKMPEVKVSAAAAASSTGPQNSCTSRCKGFDFACQWSVREQNDLLALLFGIEKFNEA